MPFHPAEVLTPRPPSPGPDAGEAQSRPAEVTTSHPPSPPAETAEVLSHPSEVLITHPPSQGLELAEAPSHPAEVPPFAETESSVEEMRPHPSLQVKKEVLPHPATPLCPPSPSVDQEQEMLVEEAEGIFTLPSSQHPTGQDSEVIHVQGPPAPTPSQPPEVSTGPGPKSRSEQITVPMNAGAAEGTTQQHVISPSYADKVRTPSKPSPGVVGRLSTCPGPRPQLDPITTTSIDSRRIVRRGEDHRGCRWRCSGESLIIATPGPTIASNSRQVGRGRWPSGFTRNRLSGSPNRLWTACRV